MTRYQAPVDDTRFALFDVLAAAPLLAELRDGAEHERSTLEAILEEAARFSEQVLGPGNATGDQEGCHYDPKTHAVTTPTGFKTAFETFAENGWSGLTEPPAHGGQGLPKVLGTAVSEYFQSGNLAWSLYPLLSEGACHALMAHAEAWQQERFLRPIIAGRWSGTMCLTEPQAGTDLGLLKTRAEPQADGSYRIYGHKIFISAGEHDLTENIVHLVLARLPDAPPGSRGISMFIVPKFKVGEDGAPGERNALFAAAIEHKMGLRGSATCAMNFEGAEGYLIGSPHKGLAAMFTMMNQARLGVGLQGLALAERALQNSLDYATERLQSRALSGPKYPERAADPLLVQPDVRRMLLTQRALVEGSRLLLLYAALQADIAARSEDPAIRQRADEILAFIIPIAKAAVTEWAQECTKEALQVYGGHGYIVDNGMEQFVRDARIITLYEGTTGIQALDLLSRKILQLRGVGFRHFQEEITAFLQTHADRPELAPLLGPLAEAVQAWGKLTLSLAQRCMADPEEIGAAAYDYLYYSAYVCLAYFWARSVAALETSGLTDAQRQAKRDTAHFYYQRLLPRLYLHRAGVEAGIGSLPALG